MADVLRGTEPDRFESPGACRQVGEQLIDRLAEIHQVDSEAIGPDEFGHPEGFTQRQVKRWREQLT